MTNKLTWVALVVLLGGWGVFESPDEDVASGNQSFRDGLFDRAVEAYRRALDGAPSDARVHYNLGTALMKQAEMAADDAVRGELLDQAEVELRGALDSQDPRLRSRAHYNLGNAAATRERYDDAIESYKQALRQDPRNRDARYNLELALRRKRLLEQQQNQDQQNQDQQNQDQQQQNQDQQQQNQDQQDQQNQDQQQQNQDQQQQNQDQQDQQNQDQQQQNQDQQDQQNQDQQDQQNQDQQDQQNQDQQDQQNQDQQDQQNQDQQQDAEQQQRDAEKQEQQQREAEQRDAEQREQQQREPEQTGEGQDEALDYRARTDTDKKLDELERRSRNLRLRRMKAAAKRWMRKRSKKDW